MAKTKIVLLYERLSRDDELQGESFSIQNHDKHRISISDPGIFPNFLRVGWENERGRK